MVLNDEAQSLLKRVGLNQYESRIYAALLSSGISTAGELSELAVVPRSRVYDVLLSLEKKGFAIVQVGRPVKYMAVAPDTVISYLKEQCENEYMKKVESYDSIKASLEKELDSFKGSTAASDGISVIKGKANVYGHIKQLISESKKKLVKVTNEEGMKNLAKHCGSTLEEAKGRGVKMKLVVKSGSSKKGAGRIAGLASVRGNRKVDGRFFIKDSEDVMMITDPEDTGVMVKSPYLASCLENLFDHAWEKGKAIGE